MTVPTTDTQTVQTLHTPDGLTLLVQERPHTHAVAIGCLLKVGACYEPARLSGVSHFLEHMCFKGTRNLPTPRIISEMIEGVGGTLDAETTYEGTTYWCKVANIHIERALHVLTEMVRYPRFDAVELEKERRVVIEEIRGLRDSPDSWVHTLIHEIMWGEQPLGRDIAGSIASVRAITHADLVQFWQDHYSLANMVIAVAGNIQAPQVAEAVSAAFAGHRCLAPQSAIPTTPPQPGPAVGLLSREIEQAHFCIGLPSLSYTDPQRRAFQVLDTILGGGMSSRLFQEVREERGLAYTIGSYHNEFSDAGIWVMYGGVEPDTLYDTIEAVLAILNDLATAGVTDAELQRVKEQVKGGMLLSLEDTWSVAARNGLHQLRYGTVIPLEQVVAEIEAVTLDDVLRVAQRLVRRDALQLALIGPYSADDEHRLRSLLEQALP
jgi:predicted Zn-dependent peptidase